MQLKNFLSTLATAGDICLFNHVAGMWPLLMTVYLEEGHGSSNSTLAENRSRDVLLLCQKHIQI